MTITDKLCFGISIAVLTIYISLFAVTQIIGYGPVNQPISNGKLCNRIYFPDLKDLSKTLCLNQCPKEGDKKLDCDNCNGNIFNTLEYDKGCLPNLYQQLEQTMPALKTPIISDFSESLIQNCYFVFLGLLFLLCFSNYCQYFYRRYSNLILTFLSNYYPYGLLWLAILMAHKISVFHDIDKLQRAGESRVLNIPSIEILVEAFNHKTTYFIILAILIKVFIANVIIQYFQSPDLEDNRLKGYISLRLRNQTIKYQKYNQVLQILFILNFLILYFSLAASLSIGQIDQSLVAYSQYQPSIVGYIFSLILFILFIYTSKILRLYTDLYIYSFSLQYLFGWQDTGVVFTKESLSFFGTVSLLAFKQMINSPKKLLIPLLKLIKKDEKAQFYQSELQLLTSLTLGRQMYHYLENKQNQGDGVAPYNFEDSCNALNIQQLDIVYILYERCEQILKHSGWSVGTLIGLFNVLIGCSFSTIFVMIPLCCDFNYCYNAFNVKGYLTIGLIEGDNADKLMNLYKSIINIELEEQKVKKQ